MTSLSGAAVCDLTVECCGFVTSLSGAAPPASACAQRRDPGGRRTHALGRRGVWDLAVCRVGGDLAGPQRILLWFPPRGDHRRATEHAGVL